MEKQDICGGKKTLDYYCRVKKTNRTLEMCQWKRISESSVFDGTEAIPNQTPLGEKLPYSHGNFSFE
ncbi:hypothetical protein CAEBREN_04307 [Caenorhabditis brenneri]|uniref:Uncharacterized protein n=1 Tax=Caenorhabditis brenneri TaxID=135651 RepID=G0NEY3_CAEBE|nr:hypothetical protein CAEBREN_04307 [Caenorhabditis brenneri]